MNTWNKIYKNTKHKQTKLNTQIDRLAHLGKLGY